MKVTGTIAQFLQPNTDTDVIIPARFLKRTSLDGFEQYAFFEKKYSSDTVCEPTMEAKDFVFQKKIYNPECTLNHGNSKDATFLLTWLNFGCGSSREHAVYAIRNFKVVIGSAPEGKSAFADIFRDNCRQNLIWTPVVSEEDHKKINNYVNDNIEKGSVSVELNSDNDTLTIGGELTVPFSIPPHHKDYILNGKDPFDMAKEQITTALATIDEWNEEHKDLITTCPNSSL